MVYNVVKESSLINENTESTSLLEAMLYIAESEGKMFDSLISVDFVDAVNEADEEAAPEVKDDKKKKTLLDVIKGIANKIWELLKKVAGAIASAIETVISKLGELLKTNQGIVDKYRRYLQDAKNLEGFEGLSNFINPSAVQDNQFLEMKIDAVIELNISDYADFVNKTESNRTKTLETAKTNAEEYINGRNEALKEVFKEQEAKVKPSVTDMQAFMDILVMKKNLIDSLKLGKKQALKRLDDMRAAAKQAQAKSETKVKANSEEGIAKAWQQFYALISVASKFNVDATNVEIAAIKNMVKYARRAVLEVGNYAMNKANGKAPKTAEAKQEAADFRDLLGTKSDIYVESVLF